MNILDFIFYFWVFATLADILGITDTPLRVLSFFVMIILLFIPETIFFIRRKLLKKEPVDKYFMDWLSKKWGF